MIMINKGRKSYFRGYRAPKASTNLKQEEHANIDYSKHSDYDMPCEQSAMCCCMVNIYIYIYIYIYLYMWGMWLNSLDCLPDPVHSAVVALEVASIQKKSLVLLPRLLIYSCADERSWVALVIIDPPLKSLPFLFAHVVLASCQVVFTPANPMHILFLTGSKPLGHSFSSVRIRWGNMYFLPFKYTSYPMNLVLLTHVSVSKSCNNVGSVWHTVPLPIILVKCTMVQSTGTNNIGLD